MQMQIPSLIINSHYCIVQNFDIDKFGRQLNPQIVDGQNFDDKFCTFHYNYEPVTFKSNEKVKSLCYAVYNSINKA